MRNEPPRLCEISSTFKVTHQQDAYAERLTVGAAMLAMSHIDECGIEPESLETFTAGALEARMECAADTWRD